MKTLNNKEICAVSGSRVKAFRQFVSWVASSAAWEGISTGIGSIEKRSGSGGQMNGERRSNMFI